jgi:tetratricopeptide (TPR) repeat protein
LALTNAELKRFRKPARWSSEIEALQATDRKADSNLQLKILMTLAYVSAQQGDLRKAESSFDEARRLIEQQPNPDPMALGTLWTHLGRVRRSQGNYIGSEQCHKTALSVLSGTLPERHLFIAFRWLDLADTYRLLRRYDDAIAHYRKGLTMAEESTGRGSGLLAVDYEMFAQVLRKKSEKAEAREFDALARKARAGSEQVRTIGFTVDIDELAPKRR